MALKCTKGGDNPANWERFAFRQEPPVAELIVKTHVEGLFWWRSFSKSIASVGAEGYVAKEGSDGPEETSAGVIDTGGEGFGDGDSFTSAL